MVKVEEVLKLAIDTDMSGLAHRVFWAITEGKVKAHEDSKKLDCIDYDQEAIAQLIEKNVLSIGKVKLFVATIKNPEIYAFYYSENVLEANHLHRKLFKEAPKRLTHAPHLLGNVFQLDEKNDPEILYFHREKVVSYPYYLGVARAGERFLDRELVTS
ncbi:hypothetical protein ACXYMX_11980 [Sporosarcina sp. CAU 1771]